MTVVTETERERQLYEENLRLREDNLKLREDRLTWEQEKREYEQKYQQELVEKRKKFKEIHRLTQNRAFPDNNFNLIKDITEKELDI